MPSTPIIPNPADSTLQYALRRPAKLPPRVALVTGTVCLTTRQQKVVNHMIMVKKSSGGGAPSLDILAAKLKVLEVELTLEETEVKPENGRPFIAEPNFNLKLEVVKNLVDSGVDEGVKFFDRFKLKKDDDGEWTFAKYSKLGNLIKLKYGEEWFDSDEEFNENDFLDLEFIAQVEPKTDPKGNPLSGSTINWKSIRPIGGKDDAEVEEETEAADEDVEEAPF